jgi:hypothetical protein
MKLSNIETYVCTVDLLVEYVTLPTASFKMDFESSFTSKAKENFLSTISTVIGERDDGSIFRNWIFVLCYSKYLDNFLTVSSMGVKTVTDTLRRFATSTAIECRPLKGPHLRA